MKEEFSCILTCSFLATKKQKQAYGSSECTGACTISNLSKHRWGSIGFEIPGCQVQILDKNGQPVPAAIDLFHPTDAEQGDICFKGRNLMIGYKAAFDGSDVKTIAAKNAESFTADGFCRSGDKGCHNAEGLFRITGRFKELLKTAGGEYVSPVPIEDAICKRAPAISKVIIIGDKRKFNTALVTLLQEGATGESPGSGILMGLVLC